MTPVLSPRFVVATCLGFCAALFAGQACTVPNPDHCLHKDFDSNAWCAENQEGRPYCSPCEGENNGCVATEPTESECPSYSVPPADEGTETGTDGGSESDTGDGGGTDGGGETTSGPDTGTGGA